MWGKKRRNLDKWKTKLVHAFLKENLKEKTLGTVIISLIKRKHMWDLKAKHVHTITYCIYWMWVGVCMSHLYGSAGGPPEHLPSGTELHTGHRRWLSHQLWDKNKKSKSYSISIILVVLGWCMVFISLIRTSVILKMIWCLQVRSLLDSLQ